MASGDTLAVLTPLHHEPPSSNYAQFDTINQHTFLAFDQTTSESAVFKWVMPRHYGGGGVTVYLHYRTRAETSGDTDWDIAVECVGDGDTDTDSDNFGTATSIDNNTVPSTLGHVDIVNGAITHSNCGSPAVGDGMRLKVTRDIADTLADDALLFAVEIKET